MSLSFFEVFQSSSLFFDYSFFFEAFKTLFALPQASRAEVESLKSVLAVLKMPKIMPKVVKRLPLKRTPSPLALCDGVDHKASCLVPVESLESSFEAMRSLSIESSLSIEVGDQALSL